MGETQVMEGTTEEIIAWLEETYPDQFLRVTVEPQMENLPGGMPSSLRTTRDDAHLPLTPTKEG